MPTLSQPSTSAYCTPSLGPTQSGSGAFVGSALQNTLRTCEKSMTPRVSLGHAVLTRVPPDVRRHSQNGSVSDRASLDIPHTSWSALTDILWDIRQRGENFDDRRPSSRPRDLTDLLRVDVRESKESSPWKGVVRSGLAAKVRGSHRSRSARKADLCDVHSS